jgi:PUA domain protein
VNLVVANNQVLFFNIRDGPYFPTLRVLHKCKSCLVLQTQSPPDATSMACADPHIMPRLRVDKGAIKFVFGGANIMCPGLTSSGATIHDEVDADTPVVRPPFAATPLERPDIAAPCRPSTRRARSMPWQSD